jgi:VanZ family protein
MRTFYRLGFAAWLAAVVLASFCAYTGRIPTSLPGFAGADKIGHFFGIGMLAFFLDGVLDRRALVKRPLEVPLGPALVLLVAGIEEYLQRLSPLRDSSFADFAADLGGVVVLTIASRSLARRVLAPSAPVTLGP